MTWSLDAIFVLLLVIYLMKVSESKVAVVPW